MQVGVLGIWHFVQMNCVFDICLKLQPRSLRQTKNRKFRLLPTAGFSLTCLPPCAQKGTIWKAKETTGIALFLQVFLCKNIPGGHAALLEMIPTDNKPQEYRGKEGGWRVKHGFSKFKHNRSKCPGKLSSGFTGDSHIILLQLKLCLYIKMSDFFEQRVQHNPDGLVLLFHLLNSTRWFGKLAFDI